MAEKENTRLLALEILLEAEKKNIFVKDALHKQLFQKQFLSKQDRAFVTRLVEGVTEYQVRLDYVIDSYSTKKVNKCKPLIRCVLRMGVYQMLYMDSVPDEAACNECVRLTKKKGFHNLAGFVNGVLRNVERHVQDIRFPKEEEDLAGYLSITYSMPLWIVKKMLVWYGEEKTRKMLKASLEVTDLTIRVNEKKISVKELTDKLTAHGIEVKEGHYVKDALHLNKINYVNRIPGFKQGEFFVQDESSMLLYLAGGAINELEKSDKQELKILDLCAAPGGKCTHFAQKMDGSAFVEARDVSEKKVSLIEENRKRLGLDHMKTVIWDALVPDETRKDWADIVIADLPCSGFGIISKKNDIKYHIKETQLTELANLQRTILTNAASYVKPGGVLLYSTCTVNPEENAENARWFLDHFSFEKEEMGKQIPEALKKFVVDGYMMQLLPGETACDGFFIAKFRKKK